jgi:hypothetical protein
MAVCGLIIVDNLWGGMVGFLCVFTPQQEKTARVRCKKNSGKSTYTTVFFSSSGGGMMAPIYIYTDVHVQLCTSQILTTKHK